MKIITIIIISILFTVQLIAQEGCTDEGACNYKPDASEKMAVVIMINIMMTIASPI